MCVFTHGVGTVHKLDVMRVICFCIHDCQSSLGSSVVDLYSTYSQVRFVSSPDGDILFGLNVTYKTNRNNVGTLLSSIEPEWKG